MTRIEIREFHGGARDWLATLEAAGGAALQQHWAYGALADQAGRQVLRVDIRQDGARIGVAQVLARPGFRVLNRGPVWTGATPQAQVQALRALAKGRGVMIATPEAPVSGFGLLPLLTPRHQAVWTLSPEVAALRAGLAGKWRNRLSGAERAGLRLRHESDPGWILAAEARQQRERGYRSLPAALVRAFPPRDRLALAVLGPRGSEPLAGAIFLRHGQGATYQTGWIGAEGRRCGAHQILLWQAALILRERGVRWLDLGNVDSSAPGRMRFKVGTGAMPRALGATCLVLPRLRGVA